MKDSRFERVAFSPGEFADLFGKSQTWGYRQIYAGKIKAITEHGRILIPAEEVDKILATAGRYEGPKPNAPRSKDEFRRLAPEIRSAWREFVRLKRSGVSPEANTTKPVPESSKKQHQFRQDALRRLSGAGRGKTTNIRDLKK